MKERSGETTKSSASPTGVKYAADIGPDTEMSMRSGTFKVSQRREEGETPTVKMTFNVQPWNGFKPIPAPLYPNQKDMDVIRPRVPGSLPRALASRKPRLGCKSHGRQSPIVTPTIILAALSTYHGGPRTRPTPPNFQIQDNNLQNATRLRVGTGYLSIHPRFCWKPNERLVELILSRVRATAAEERRSDRPKDESKTRWEQVIIHEHGAHTTNMAQFRPSSGLGHPPFGCVNPGLRTAQRAKSLDLTCKTATTAWRGTYSES